MLVWVAGSFYNGQQSGADGRLFLHHYSSRSCLPG